MHVLITGHLGYIGPIMTRVFKQAGHQVTGLDVGYFRDCMVAGQSWTPPDREIYRDIRNVERGDLAGIDAIVHLAALSNDPLGELKPGITADINQHASVRLAKLAKEAGIQRFVYASSCSIYGAASNSNAALDETAPFNPVSAYAVSKVNTEAALTDLADDRFSPVYMRNATAYGLSPRLRLDLVVNNLVAWAIATNTIKVMSDGTPWRPLVHIEDISRAALAAATAPREAVHNQPFNIGRNDANYQVSDVAKLVKARLPKSEIVITGETGGDPRSYRVDFTKALTRLPGFDPQWTLQRGIDEVATWCEAQGVGHDAINARIFIRLRQIRHLIETGQCNDELVLSAS